MNYYIVTNFNKLMDDKEVAAVLDFWNNSYNYQLLQTENSLVVMDKQLGGLMPTTIKEMVKFYIFEIESKLHFIDSEVLKKDLEVLKFYDKSED